MNEYKVKVKGKRFIYNAGIKLTGKGEGIIESRGKPSIKLSTPVEFGGKPGIWTPEELLVASVNSCFMTTFSYYAVKKDFKFISYESQAEGIVELFEMKYSFSRIIIRPKIIVRSKDDIETAENLLIVSEEKCFITNSVKSKIILEPEIIMASQL
jgi:organic hydroperoxide reductase OsmC/OhrA